MAFKIIFIIASMLVVVKGFGWGWMDNGRFNPMFPNIMPLPSIPPIPPMPPMIPMPPIPKFPNMPPVPWMHEMPKMPKMPEMPKMDSNSIRNYVPGNGEEYTGYSQSSHSSVNIVNGKKTEEGGASEIRNTGGNVKEKAMEYAKDHSRSTNE